MVARREVLLGLAGASVFPTGAAGADAAALRERHRQTFIESDGPKDTRAISAGRRGSCIVESEFLTIESNRDDSTVKVGQWASEVGIMVENENDELHSEVAAALSTEEARELLDVLETAIEIAEASE